MGGEARTRSGGAGAPLGRGRVFVSGLLAGVCIALGGTALLSLEDRVLGALFFTVGLFTICTFGFHLFTGKVCYVFQRSRAYALDLPVIWLGNLAGTALVALAERCTRIGPALAAKAARLCGTKLEDGPLSLFLLALGCNLLIYIAVEGYGSGGGELKMHLSLFFGVAVFILCGFEHCVANMYYFSMAGMWSGKALVYLLVMTLGNAVGGVLLPLARQWLAAGPSKPA